MTTDGRTRTTRGATARADATPSGSPGGSPRADAAFCERVVREHARTFTYASYFLPAEKRRAAFALYAFCRIADDMVDAETADSSAARRLADYERELSRALAGAPTTPVFNELRWAVRSYGVPDRVLYELLAGVARDLRPVRYATWPDLARYCEGVASTVGEMCTHVFGVRGGAETRDAALRYARALGVAMQLTNILRDVGEDARRGRCYLPEEDLLRFGLTQDEVLDAARSGVPRRGSELAADPRWKRFMAFQVRRARAIYEEAMPGIDLLERDTRRCASACACGYAGILDAIERRSYDTFTGRARVGGWGRLAVLWDAWRHDEGTRIAPLHGGPSLAWDAERDTANDEVLRWA
jgi:phytoene synthase